MAFNEDAFMIAGTAIAIFGVGLYIWDTRKDSFKSAAASGYNAATSGYTQLSQHRTGGTRRRQKNGHYKTRRH
jgi:hypothetical protein